MSVSPKEKIKTILKLFINPKVFSQLISFQYFGYLLETGWLNSFKLHNPVDSSLRPIPWFTYSAIDFIDNRVDKSHSLLEFGSGNSTLFFSERVEKVVSIEHNKIWYEKIGINSPRNVELIITSNDTSEHYLYPIVKQKRKFDIIVVDGLFRNECLLISINLLKERGVIILDDSERGEYTAGIKYLIDNGMKQLEFTGIAPGIFFKKCTTVFYRAENCLRI